MNFRVAILSLFATVSCVVKCYYAHALNRIWPKPAKPEKPAIAPREAPESSKTFDALMKRICNDLRPEITVIRDTWVMHAGIPREYECVCYIFKVTHGDKLISAVVMKISRHFQDYVCMTLERDLWHPFDFRMVKLSNAEVAIRRFIKAYPFFKLPGAQV